LTNPRYARIASRAHRRSEYCRAPEEVFNFPFEVEHIIPPAHGRGDSDDNLALFCRSCNVRKGMRIADIDPVTGVAIRLFHPRNDQWSDHFRVDVEHGTIEALSVIGRISIVRMGMNSAPQLEARRF
jgi:hypothetical protein